MRVLAPLLLLAAAATAQADFDERLAAAERVLWDAPPWATWEERLNVQYEALGRLGVEHHGRWEVHFQLGLNRCKRAFFAHGEAEAYVARIRAQGADHEVIAVKQEGARQMIDFWLREARDNFDKMKYWMRRRGEWDPNRVLFGEAAYRFAARRYESKGRDKGAIEYFKELVRRKFLPDVCADHIALCYMDLGYAALQEQDYEEAQRLWDEGLRWARQPRLREMLRTNKAGAYESDNQYQQAEEVLRDQLEKEPYRPEHHKNLGLVLGYQGRLKEALVHYGKARDLCRNSPEAERLSLMHGNAWIRAATIHGSLLEHDGDILLAWRLFLEYRAMFGDDYNFSLWFGDFAANHGRYDLAWRYLTRARDLQPHCTVPYQKLTHIAYRTSGTREEIEARVAKAKQALAEAQRNYLIREESPAVKRLCGGLGDIGDIGIRPQRASFLDPDPLAGFTFAEPPPWIQAVAEERAPFAPWRPAGDVAGEGSAEAGGGAPVPAPGSGWFRIAAIVAAALVALAAAVFLFRRRVSTA